jgi:hypothetical protein
VGIPRPATALAKSTPGATAVGCTGSSLFWGEVDATTSLKARSNRFCWPGGRGAVEPRKPGRAGLILGTVNTGDGWAEVVGVVRLSGGDEVDELVKAVLELNRASLSGGDVRTSEMRNGAGGCSVGVVGLLETDGGKG